ncbi:hypothetical protein KAT08_03665 [Candidatus Babeliales bacterium]|nr:hypothetical protein [Candidatus Babeliales bacterium]
MNKIRMHYLLLITLFSTINLNLNPSSEIPIHIKITETKENDTTIKKEKDVYHISIKPYEKKVITNNPQIICSLIDKTKKMTLECKNEFENIEIIPMDIHIKNNSQEKIILNSNFFLENKLCLSKQYSLKIIKEKLLNKKRATRIISSIFPIMLTIPTGMLSYYLAPSGIKAAKMFFYGLKKTPTIFSKIFSLPFAIPASCTTGLFLTLKYLTPNKLIKLYEKILLQNHTNKGFINYFVPIITLNTIQKTLEIIEKIKNKNTKLKQIIIQPSQTFKTTIFVKNKERDNIYQNIIIPELSYTIEN